MERQSRVVSEYRSILSELKLLRGESAAAIFRRLETGWLTPGSEILERIENQEVSLQKILRQSRSLLRKWFSDLSDQGKGRFIDLLRLVCVNEEVQEM